MYPGWLHTGPSPVVSTEASPASPPSSFYPLCIFYPSVDFFRLSPGHLALSARRTTRFLSFSTRFSSSRRRFGRLLRAASAGGEKHPSTTTRRQGANTATPILTPSCITTAPAETLFSCLFSMSASLNISQGFSSLVACTLVPPFYLPPASLASSGSDEYQQGPGCWRPPCPETTLLQVSVCVLFSSRIHTFNLNSTSLDDDILSHEDGF